MKKILSITLLTCLISVTTIFLSNGYAQTKDTAWIESFRYDTAFVRHDSYWVDTIIVHTDTVPFIFSHGKKQMDSIRYYKQDSSKYYYRRYLALKHKGVRDSANKYYWMLKKLNK